MTSNQSLQGRAFHKLLESNLYQTYRTAFRLATGLTIHLIPADEEDDSPAEACGNPFCERLNRKLGCEGCQESHQRLLDGADRCGRTVTCFAGFKESAIPVRSGQLTVGFLRMGQVFAASKSEEEYAKVEERLPKGLSAKERKQLKEDYQNSSVVPPEQYMGCVTLLSSFAAQLSEELNRIVIAEENSEPPMVTAAKQYVNAHLEEKIVLDEVANYVHVSPYYFCKMFKQSTGMTLTEYVNRRRVERAKRRLLNPQARVTEVAYDVGYQSLSQFNRSFLKYAGKSPTQYRAQSASEGALCAA